MYVNIICKVVIFIVLNKSITSWRHFFSRKMLNNNQCIISSKNNNIYCDNEAKKYIDENEFLKRKKIMTISPGGFKGFYLLGILSYIKENYNVENFIYSGASAGSWNSLFMCYKGDTLQFVYNLLDSNIRKAKSITEIEYFIKYKLLTSYKEDDFDLRRLFIGVTSFKNFKTLTNIFSDFNNLEDAINCCIASSHIPLITGGLTNKYHNMFTFDGGFSSYPYLNTENFVLHVSPSMWETFENNSNPNNIKRNIKSLKKYSEFFSISKNNLLELFDDGYHDAKEHKTHFDEIFIPKFNDFDDDIIEI